MSVATTILAYLLIFVFFASDRFIRRDEKARSLNFTESDRKSTYFIVLAYTISILLLLFALLLNGLRLGELKAAEWLGWIGVLMMVSGIALRAWATRTLGRFYTRTLLTTDEHRIVQEGPYKLVRHPGYSGSLLVWIGAGLATTNWIIFVLVTLVCCGAYFYRMRSEEAMLSMTFGEEYRDYIRKTRRLIPFIY